MTPLRPLRRWAAALGGIALAGAALAPSAAADAGRAPAPDPEPAPTASAVPGPEQLRSPATPRAGTTMSFDGRGWGHGRGMSQYGSQGYATNFGWSRNQILDHYYGGTRGGSVSEAVGLSVDTNAVRIRLIALDGKPLVVSSTDGTVALAGAGALTLPPGTSTVRLARVDRAGGGHELRVEAAASCAGPFAPVGADGRSGSTQITVSRASGSDHLRVCRDDGVSIWYPGTLRAVIHDGTQRAVNVTSIEQQLRSVVPRESPASWDADALQSQSVAARSYALAGDTRHQPYADTCDTTLCQVYMGNARQDPGKGREPTTDSRTDAAIVATAGIVRLDGSNRIARTEFSSTSGGWTAGGTFPAVRDEGDAISPLHTWERTYAVTALESAYGGGQRLVEIEVVRRNGLGADGGRVLDTRLHFADGSSRDVPGDTVRSRLGMLSNWFTPTCGTGIRYLQEVYDLFVERAPTAAEIEQWCGVVQRGEQFLLTDALSVSDEWAGVQIAGLYTKILRRPAEPSGRAYWLALVADGLRVEDIAAEFYGSQEYFQRNGSTNRAFVAALYDDLLGRPANASGLDFWTRMLGRGVTRSEVAGEFYASIESRVDRVDALFREILGRAPDPGGRAYWAQQLLTLGDVRLAAWLAASEEYYFGSIG